MACWVPLGLLFFRCISFNLKFEFLIGGNAPLVLNNSLLLITFQHSTFSSSSFDVLDRVCFFVLGITLHICVLNHLCIYLYWYLIPYTYENHTFIFVMISKQREQLAFVFCPKTYQSKLKKGICDKIVLRFSFLGLGKWENFIILCLLLIRRYKIRPFQNWYFYNYYIF